MAAVRKLGLAASATCALAVMAWTPAARAGAGRIVKGPYLTGLSDTGVDVRFELDGPAAATVDVVRAQTTDKPTTVPSLQAAAFHLVHADGLQPSTRYVYAVRMGASVIGKGTFTTAPQIMSNAPVAFLVYGDNRTDAAAHEAVVRAMVQAPGDFLVHTGDMVEDGGNAQDWQTFFDIEAPLLRDRPIFMAIGNHELYDDAAGANFARYFAFVDEQRAPRLYGTARLSNVRLFFLNAMHDWDSGEERAWLERELTKADTENGVGWRIAVLHHSPWSAGPHGPNPKLVDGHVPELLAAHKVDLVLAGHDHIYERGEAGPLKYVISGGGGAPLNRVDALAATTRKAESTYHFIELKTGFDGIQLLVKRIDGTELDRCTLRKGGPWDCPAPAAAAPPTPPRAVPPTPAGAATQSGCNSPGGGAAWAVGAVALAGAVFVWTRRRRRS
jgi:MYXO-CTERM domain-containing protein